MSAPITPPIISGQIFIDESKKLILASISLVTALAWNSAFQNFFDAQPALRDKGPWVHALLMTLFSVIAVFLMARF
jgi:hypothetical protein